MYNRNSIFGSTTSAFLALLLLAGCSQSDQSDSGSPFEEISPETTISTERSASAPQSETSKAESAEAEEPDRSSESAKSAEIENDTLAFSNNKPGEGELTDRTQTWEDVEKYGFSKIQLTFFKEPMTGPFIFPVGEAPYMSVSGPVPSVAPIYLKLRTWGLDGDEIAAGDEGCVLRTSAKVPGEQNEHVDTMDLEYRGYVSNPDAPRASSNGEDPSLCSGAVKVYVTGSDESMNFQFSIARKGYPLLNINQEIRAAE
ncbi:hypothetical protein GWO69_01270 [Corynebacterium macginleyi]|uniref:Lipoprotein n=1 Tax=Corynebacterium macginleyi TaxID=38290 RepID=A0A3M0GGU2_9CORY|nr:hypothetical protein [Corynebacterium macginleyi]MBK4156148.1 hypothetical protein [Corynebacterium macginleyi]QRJ57424.1 hypothetical protein GWO64_009205 [Corynebacterium macginleyi]RMB60813.1 hypothetical protein D9543_05750 [Corynebacterium macginleyi]